MTSDAAARAARLAGDRLEARSSGASTTTRCGTNTVVGPGSDAAVLRIKGTTQGASPSRTDGNARYTLPRPVRRRRDRRRGGRAQRRLHRREADRDHGLPELRQPGEAGRLLPARGGDPRHGRRRARARHPGGQRQRQPVQRDERRRDLADAGRRRARPARRRRARRADGVPGGGRLGDSDRAIEWQRMR